METVLKKKIIPAYPGSIESKDSFNKYFSKVSCVPRIVLDTVCKTHKKLNR